MAHDLHGIITSFRYDGELPHVILVGNFHFIPTENHSRPSYSESTLAPYSRLTKDTRKALKELSFKGKCAYIETLYHGGQGAQRSEVWHNGKKILGPLISFDGVENPTIPAEATQTDHSINEALSALGVYQHEGKDEFDSVRLGWYRSNSEAIEEFNLNQLKTKPR